jgi:hypothetical protein
MASTAYVVEKEQLIEKILSVLSAHGYSKNEGRKMQFIDRLRNLLNSNAAWNPDIFLVHNSEGILAADVQLLEERQPQYIPVAMKLAVSRIDSSLGSVEAVLYIPMGGVLEASTIEKAVALNIKVDAIDQAGIIHRVLNPSCIGQIHSATDEERNAVKTQVDSGWVIPKALIEKLQGITKLEYADCLQQFARVYTSSSTPIRLSVQYKLAYQCVENIFKSYDLDLCCRSLRVTKELEKMAREKGTSRDHFLHEFQTFLIGALILDKSESLLSSPLALCSRYPRMDLPWLVASIFHDYGFDLVNLESCIDTSICEFKPESKVNLRCSTLLNSLYNFQKNNRDLDRWDPDTYQAASSNFEKILFRAALEQSAKKTGERLRANHGVLSAHEIMNLEESLSKQKPVLRPIFLSSALSASMHDKVLWAELFSNSIFPLDATQFQLVYLLIFCDTLAEAGRPRKATTKQQDAVLVSFNVQNNVISSSVWFSERERALTMNFWSRFVQEKCFNNPFLKLECRSLL